MDKARIRDALNALTRLLSAAGLFVALTANSAHAMGDEDFVGPFPSWANVETGYGAKGDGTTDDTAAIQAALDSLGSTKTTLYFPAGTYRITQTLNLPARIHVNIIGEDPSTTKIVWDGKSGGARSTMLYLNGLAYSRIDRLTFDGQGKADIAVDQSWAGSGNYFDTGNEYADDIFENVGTGLRCGNRGYGCAETSMLRDKFVNDNVAGVAMKNFNALDLFIWDSLFKDCAEGVTNAPGAGNFHVYDSIFEGSTSSDIAIGNTGLFNFRSNTSIGSNRFIGAGGTNNPANITIQNNTILDTANATSIAIGNFGPIILLDNTIRSRAGVTTGPAVVAAGWGPTDLFSMGNIFTVSSPTKANGHYHVIDDRVVDRGTVNPPMPSLPGTPPNANPQIFEVAPGATAAQIQQIIDEAAAAKEHRPVVHIPAGSYRIDTTLEVPANSDMQIIGDGYSSRLTWSGKTSGPVLRLEGPSKAILREFSVNGNGHSSDGIEVDDADQAGGRVFMESPFLSSSYTNLFVDGLDHTKIELHDFEHGSAQNNADSAVSVEVTGGPSAARGRWLGGTTNIFAGASDGNNTSYRVSGGAHLGIRDIWYDAGGGGGQQIASITGKSTFTYAGSAVYHTCSSSPAIAFHDFHGTAALLNLNMSCNVEISGDGSGAKVAAIGLVSAERNFFANESSPASQSEFLNGQTTASPPPGSGSSEIAELGTLDAPFLTAALNQVRTEQPTLLSPLPKGVTDVRFYRVFVDSAINGIHLEAATTPHKRAALSPHPR
ncbi:MAG: glycosyl hydrolase family 28-related protein [Rhizomicrobium sp.]